MSLPYGRCCDCGYYNYRRRFQRVLKQLARDRLEATFTKFKQHLKQAKLTKQLVLYDLVTGLYISQKKTF